MSANLAAPIITWDNAPLRQQFGDSLIVVDGVATLANGTQYRINASANRYGKSADVTLRYLTPAKRGHVVPETVLVAVRDKVREVAATRIASFVKAERDARRPALCPACDNTGAAQGDCVTCCPATAESVQREAAADMGFQTVRLAPPVPVTIKLNSFITPALVEATRARHASEDAAANARTDNVEWHAGRKAFADGVASDSCPYFAGGERAARWLRGWNDARDASSPVVPDSFRAGFLAGLDYFPDDRPGAVDQWIVESYSAWLESK